MARGKAGDKAVTVGDLRDISGEVSIAAGDIYKGFTAQQVSVLLTQITSTFEPRKFDGRCPYKGLDVFEEEDAELFFGREKLVDDLLGRVGKSRAVFITGPSGSGKSSLVRAGLIHALKQGRLQNSNGWLYETIKPGRSPLEVLALAFSRLKSPELANYFRAHAHESGILNECAESALSGRTDQRLVLFVDQFEEAFTQISREDERAAFLNVLTSAASVENGRVILLFAMRSDFVSNCAAYPELNSLLNQQFIQIGAMQPGELVSAIAQPALRVGLRIDPDLIAQIINDMEGEPGTLPLMQFALKDLFDSEQARGGIIALTLNGYLEREGIHKALERHADASFAKLEKNEQELARSIFSGLIEVGQGTHETRRTALMDELIPADAKAEDVERIIQKLADARLITTDEEAGRDTVTISHEKLIDAWPWLKKLAVENQDVIALQNEIKNDAKEWDDHKRDPSYLYSGARLINARERLESRKLVLSGMAMDFVRASRRRQQRSRLALAGALSLVIVSLIAAAIIFRGQSQENASLAEEARKQANTASARELAAVAVANLDLDPELSLHLAKQSLDESYTLQGEEALRRALLAPAVELTLRGHSGAIYSVAYDHEGKRLVTASADGTARIWDSANGQEILALRGHEGAVNGAAFSPDGRLVATAGADKTVRLWDAGTGQQVRSMDQHEAAINSVAFSPDGRSLVTASDDKTARVWDAASGREVYVLDGHTASVRAAVFSPDGGWIATGGYDQMINLWDARSGELISSLNDGSENPDALAFSSDSQYLLGTWGYNVLRWDVAGQSVVTQYTGGHTWYTTSVAFNPSDARQVVTASRDHTVRIWDGETGDQIDVLRGQGGAVYSIVFNPSGDHLAAASEDQTVRIWNLAEWRRRVLIGYAKYVPDAVYSPDGRRIATTDSNGMIRIWDSSTGQELKSWLYPDWVANRVQFSPDGQQIITSSDDGTWRIWDAGSGRQLFESNPIPYVVSSAGFNRAGTRIITTARDNLGVIWDADTKQQLVQLKGHGTGIWTGAFSPDGRLAVTASADRTARIWDVQTGEQLHVLAGHGDLVTSAAFSPDGKRVVTTSVDGTARIWDAGSGEMLHILKEHTREVTEAVFSPDDKYIATASRDHTVMLWNADTGEKIMQLFGHSSDVVSVAFSPDGRYLLTSGLDGLVRIQPVRFEDVLAMARSLISGRELTCTERVKYLHEEVACPTPTPASTGTP